MNALAVMSMVATTGNRFCVHHATHAGMQGDWKSRLLEAIDKSGRSGRDLSRKVKMGPNTISELRLTDKVPSFDKVLRLIDELGASRAYIILGYEIGPKEEALLKALAGLEPEALSTLTQPRPTRRGFCLPVDRARQEPRGRADAI